MTQTSPIVEQPPIEHTFLYELNELIGAYLEAIAPEWFIVGAIVVILNYFAFKK
jgi:hypothetical protein